MRSALALAAALASLAACKTAQPVVTEPSFVTSPALALRNPADVAVLPVEDGTPDGAATALLTHMRAVLQRNLPNRLYSPLASRVVDAALASEERRPGETLLTPAYLKRIAGKSTEDAALAVRVDRWDESQLLLEKRVRFQLQAALIASDGEMLWHGAMTGEAKAGGAGAAPRDKEGMARSCAELAMIELLNNLTPRAKP